MTLFKTGDRVRLIKKPWDNKKLPIGSLGTVQPDDSHYPFVDWDVFEGGHDRPFGDGRKSCWAVYPSEMEAAPVEPKKPRTSKPKASDTKIAKLRAHLLAGRSITQLEAIALYSAFRLAARIHDLKAEGMKIDTFMKEDPNGSPYAEYRLRSKRVR